MYRDDSSLAPSLKGWGLTKSFGSGEMLTVALSNVSMELYPGQVALLMGPSGSGKSTLLAVLSGLMKPDEGRVLSHDQDLWGMNEVEREAFRFRHCGFIFQGYNLFPALTARQQLEMMLQWGKGISGREARERSSAMLDLLGLSKKANLRPLQMSGGEKQRVAIGRALIKEPSFLFCDEPTAALDWKHGEQVIDLLHTAAHDQGATVLIVAHDSRIISHVDRVFSLEDGCLHEGAERPLAMSGLPSLAGKY
jgi:putative ABC transport system ATP-binding protein